MGIVQSNRRSGAARGGAKSKGKPPFDPAEHTVDEVLAHVEANPDDADRVLQAERHGQNRVTAVREMTAPVTDPVPTPETQQVPEPEPVTTAPKKARAAKRASKTTKAAAKRPAARPKK